jgi:hypothetical protein
MEKTSILNFFAAILLLGIISCVDQRTQSPRCPNMPDRASQMQTLRELEGIVFLGANLKDNNHWYLTADSRVWENMMKQDPTTMEKSLFCLSLVEGQRCCRTITVQDSGGFSLYEYSGPK